jgi:hypothetical protein
MFRQTRWTHRYRVPLPFFVSLHVADKNNTNINWIVMQKMGRIIAQNYCITNIRVLLYKNLTNFFPTIIDAHQLI